MTCRTHNWSLEGGKARAYGGPPDYWDCQTTAVSTHSALAGSSVTVGVLFYVLELNIVLKIQTFGSS